MAVAVKNAPGTASSSPFDRPWVVSLIGVLYVLGCLAIVFKLIPGLWWSAWPEVSFASGTLLVLLCLTVAGALFYLGARLLGPNPPEGARAGIFLGLVGVLIVLLLTRWFAAWLERGIYDRHWFGASKLTYGVALVSAVGVVLLGFLVYLLTRPRAQRWAVTLERGGWFSMSSYKPSQGLKVRRGTIAGILLLVGAGVYTLISHGTLKRGARDWALDIPFTGWTTLETMGDAQSELAAPTVAGQAKVEVRRAGDTKLPQKQVIPQEKYVSGVKGVLASPDFPTDEATAKMAEGLRQKAEKDVAELVVGVNDAYRTAIVQGLGQVKVLWPGAANWEDEQAGKKPLVKTDDVVRQGIFREAVRGSLQRSDFLSKEEDRLRQELGKAAAESDLDVLLRDLYKAVTDALQKVLKDGDRIQAARKRLRPLVVRSPGLTKWKAKEEVSQKAFRAEIARHLKEKKFGSTKASKKLRAALERANEKGDVEGLIRTINEELREGMVWVVDIASTYPPDVAKRLKAKLPKDKNADVGGLVDEFRSEAKKAKVTSLPPVFDLPIVAVRPLPAVDRLAEARKAWEANKQDRALTVALLKELVRLQQATREQQKEKKGKAELLSPVLTLPPALNLPLGEIADRPLFRAQRDVQKIEEAEEKSRLTPGQDITPLVEEYAKIVHAEKVKKVVSAGEVEKVKGLKGEKEKFKVGALVPERELQEVQKRCRDEGLTPPEGGDPLPAVFRLPIGLLVVDRYVLQDLNDKLSKMVKVVRREDSNFQPGQLVTPDQLKAEKERVEREFGTAPTTGPATLASGPTEFATLPLLPSVQYTLPLLLLLAAIWLAWRIVNIPTFADFLIATEAELNKVSWTTQRRLVQDTIVVLVTVVLMAGFLFAADQVWRKLLSWGPVGVLVFPKDKESGQELEQKNW
jgi:preprotein translocase SecE subunit